MQKPATTHYPSVVTDSWLPALSTSTLLQLVLLAGIFLLNFFPGTDPDFWWHMATGRLIAETGAIPRSDPFSYTAVGKPWIAHEWLAELIIYLLYRSGGYLALVVVFGAMMTATFGAVLRTLRTLGLGPIAASCITFWVAIMSIFGWDVRPQVFSYLLFSLYLFLLVRSRRRADRWLWLLPPLMIPWVNLHAGYVMGLMLVGAFVAGELLNRWRRGDAETRGRGEGTSLRRYLAVAAATIAATVANPQGLSMLLYPFSYAGTQNASMRTISEWQSPDFHYYFFFIFGASMMVLMVAPSRRPVDWALGIPLLLLTAMSLQSVRVIPFYGIGAAPFLGIRLALRREGGTGGRGDAERTPPPAPPRCGEGRGADPLSLWEREKSQGEREPTHHSSLITHHSPLIPHPSRATRWNWLVLGICLATMASTLLLSDRTQLGPEPRAEDYPVAGVQYLREAGLEGNLFNTFHWGGFLIWSFYPERKVFIDGRPDMYGDQFVDDYGKVSEALPGWREVLEENQVEVALVQKDSRIATLLTATGEWRELYRGELESVLVKSRP